MRCDAPDAILEYLWTPSAFDLSSGHQSGRPRLVSDWRTAHEVAARPSAYSEYDVIVLR